MFYADADGVSTPSRLNGSQPEVDRDAVRRGE